MIESFRNRLNLLFLKRRHKGFSIGKDSIITHETKVWINQHALSIGDNVFINSRKKGYHSAMPFPTTFLIDVTGAFIKIGNWANLNGVFVHAQKGIIIGEKTVIASGVVIIDSNGHNVHSSDRTKGRDVPVPIVIGNNVWIGINAVILKGTIIGDNSVISAGAIVKGNYPPNSIISGNPATITGTVTIKN